MFATNVENLENLKSYLFFKKSLSLSIFYKKLLIVLPLVNMKKYLKKKNQLKY